MYFVKNLVIKNILSKTYVLDMEQGYPCSMVLDDSESESLEYGYRKTLKKNIYFLAVSAKNGFCRTGGGVLNSI